MSYHIPTEFRYYLSLRKGHFGDSKEVAEFKARFESGSVVLQLIEAYEESFNDIRDDRHWKPISLKLANIGDFFETRGGWAAQLVHIHNSAYAEEYKEYFFVHIYGNITLEQTRPIPHQSNGEPCYSPYYSEPLNGKIAPIIGGTHPADIVQTIALEDEYQDSRYVLRYKVTREIWTPRYRHNNPVFKE